SDILVGALVGTVLAILGYKASTYFIGKI
ncbi:MAG: hypothetical protein ACI849_001664, partial [Patiriisocius sp.]